MKESEGAESSREWALVERSARPGRGLGHCVGPAATTRGVKPPWRCREERREADAWPRGEGEDPPGLAWRLAGAVQVRGVVGRGEKRRSVDLDLICYRIIFDLLGLWLGFRLVLGFR